MIYYRPRDLVLCNYNSEFHANFFYINNHFIIRKIILFSSSEMTL